MMYWSIFFVVCFIATNEGVKWHELDEYTFDHYQIEFSKNYALEEKKLRKDIFESTLSKIRRHNADASKTWKMGVNHLTDRTEEEFGRLLGLKKGLLYQQSSKRSVPNYEKISVKDLPTNVDWREKNVITSVKDQGDCGSCWTFATAQLTESYYALSSGQLHDLSEQQILDCTPNPQHCGGTGGCGGGTAELAWDRIKMMGGLSSEWTYPYTSYFGNAYACHPTRIPVVRVSGYVNLPTNEQDPILNHLATTGPLAISVDAASWAHYESGVFNGCNQTNPDLDHAVQLVGYGTDTSLGDYWLVRNSWSPAWGEKGYIRLKRTTEIICGIDTTPQDGDGCTGGPPTVKVCGTCGILFDGVYPTVSS